VLKAGHPSVDVLDMARQILIADDERLSRFLTQSILEKLGFQVELCDDGRGAVEAEATMTSPPSSWAARCRTWTGSRRRPRYAGSRTSAEVPVPRSSASAHGPWMATTRWPSPRAWTYITKPQTIRKVRAALEQVGIEVDAARSAVQ
jgi:DNA-binding NtrC family response regulator